MNFRTRLIQRLDDFNVEDALKLSDELHAYESSGGHLNLVEDTLWRSLTLKIESSATAMRRSQVIPYISYAVDNALSEHNPSEMPANARLVGWQCGFEPLFVAVWSYLGNTLEDAEAIEMATDLLEEKKWFSGEATPPDYVL